MLFSRNISSKTVSKVVSFFRFIVIDYPPQFTCVLKGPYKWTEDIMETITSDFEGITNFCNSSWDMAVFMIYYLGLEGD